VAWRLGRRLGIPVAVWATGSDIRQREGTTAHKSVARTLSNADLVIYQSRELLEIGARIKKATPSALLENNHLILSRGIPEPPLLPKEEVRKRERLAVNIAEDEILVSFIGRVTRSKGIFELLEAIAFAASRNSKIKCLIIGSKPAFDETKAIEKKLNETPALRGFVKILPACDPDKVWEYLCAADIFAFPSHNEGMPNSLLEAMAMGVPSVAFAIPPVVELDNGSGALMTVPPLDAQLFARAIEELAASPETRQAIGAKGKTKVLKKFSVRKSMAEAVDRLSALVNERVSADRVARLSAEALPNS
jgi:glycosyltransferase involved in cell wall biosynthesis